MGKFATAWSAFWRILKDDDVARAWKDLSAPRQLAEAPSPAPETEAAEEEQPDVLYSLILLQREGRLVDFLNEDISACTDEQVGAAIRQIHAKCRSALDENFAVQPILNETEGARVEIPAGFDPSAIRLSGNVKGDPPFAGTLVHPGWRAGKMAAPERGPSVDPTVITPAEVEL